jgi:enterochelin esterase-like enzyme
MSPATKRARSRPHVWLDGLGDWSWPGQSGVVAAEVLPPPWVPSFPPKADLVSVPVPAPAAAPSRARRVLIAALLAALAAVTAALGLRGQLTLEQLGLAAAHDPAPAAITSTNGAVQAQPLPTLTVVGGDAAGSSIDETHYPSVTLRREGSFIVYLPPGYSSTSRRYPVLYLLHGNSQRAEAFLELGLQGQLDRLIARHAIPPVIAVMIQGGPGANNWRDIGSMRYESYVLEVQELVDRMLPTIANRGSRAIAGDSMGGYGAMNVALGNPFRFGVVESWLGFFNGLGDELRADRPILKQQGLYAFIYGGKSDRIADPSEDAPFARSLRAAGADAHSRVYPGEHTMETLQAHLESMLTFAGKALAKGR